MKKNKVFFTHLYNDYSGSPRVLRDAIEAVSETNNELIVITNKTQGFLSEINNVEYSFIHYYFHKNKIFQLFLFLFSQLELFIKLSFLLIKYRCAGYNCKVVNNTVLPFGGGLAAAIFSKYSLYYIHETSIRPYVLKKFLLFIIKLTADKVIFVSSYLKNELSLNADSIVIYNTLRSDFSLSENLDYKSKYEKKMIFFAGSLKDYKGIYNLLKIAKKLPLINFSVALNCTEKEFNIFTKQHSEYKNITFNHRPENIEQLYRESCIILNLSIPELCVETFGLSILEGITYGCVPIVPPIGGPLELINDDFGYAISSNNIDEIVVVISNLLSSYDDWLRQSQNAETFAKNFDRKSFKNKLLSVLDIK